MIGGPLATWGDGTGAAAEALGRQWISCDLDREGDKTNTYVRASAFRFDSPALEPDFDYALAGDYRPESFDAKERASRRRVRRAE